MATYGSTVDRSTKIIFVETLHRNYRYEGMSANGMAIFIGYYRERDEVLELFRDSKVLNQHIWCCSGAI